MRDVRRIEGFLKEFGELWGKHYPDWRFGQLIFNFICAYGDPFHLEEDEFLVALKAYINNQDPRDAVLEYLNEKIPE